MKRNLFVFALFAIALSIVPMTVWAHHSVSAEFDNDKPLEFKGGVVKAVEWTNPHIDRKSTRLNSSHRT